MTLGPASWRPMQPADLPAVNALAVLIHPGYPEDAATGIAATALASGLRQLGVTSSARVTVHQGEAMGRPSKITVTFRGDQCWLSGHVELLEGQGK